MVYSRNWLINTVYHLLVNRNKGDGGGGGKREKGGGRVDFLPLKREGLLERGA